MKTELEQAIEFVEKELAFYRKTVSFKEADYYVRMYSKGDMLQEVLNKLNDIKAGK